MGRKARQLSHEEQHLATASALSVAAADEQALSSVAMPSHRHA